MVIYLMCTRDHGFDSPEAHLKAVANEPTREELLHDIREGILAVKRGDPMPTLDDLWAALEDDC